MGLPPVIKYNTVNTFDLKWTDLGTGCDTSVGIWQPKLGNGEWMMGHYAQNNWETPYQPIYVITGIDNDDPKNPALKAPKGYYKLWDFWGLIIWHPVAPDGYVPCGSVATHHTNPPDFTNLACVRSDLTTVFDASRLQWVWNDRGSGNTHHDVSIWRINRINMMVATEGYNRPNRTIYVPSNIPLPPTSTP